MKKRKQHNPLLLILTIVVLSLFKANFSFGQDAHFSQYFASSLYLNPSMVGVEEYPVFRSNFRTQWRSVTLPYVTSQVTVIKPITPQPAGSSVAIHKGGVGISFYNDKAGDGNFKTLGMYLSGAYTIHLGQITGHNLLVFGLQGGILQKQLDFTNLEWGAQYNSYLGFDPTMDPMENSIVPTIWNPDFSAGMTWFYNSDRNFQLKKLSIHSGIAVSHLIPVDESLFNNPTGPSQILPMLFKYHGGLEFKISKRLHYNAALLLQRQNSVNQVNVGSYLNFDLNERSQHGLNTHINLLGGVWYRLGDSYIAMLGIENPYYTLGFSYDLNTSQLRTDSRGRGAYEVSIAIRQVKERKQLIFSTPRI